MKRSLLLAISALALTATSQQLIAAESETAAPQERAAPAAERQRAAPARQLQRAPVQRQGAQSSQSSSFTGSQAGGFGGGNAGGGGFADPTFCGFSGIGFSPSCPPTTQNIPRSRVGFAGGAEYGYMFPLGPYAAAGFAVDVTGSTMKASNTQTTSHCADRINCPSLNPPVTETLSTDQSQGLTTTYRMKIGFVPMQNILVFGTAGGATGKVSGSSTYTATNNQLSPNLITAFGASSYDQTRTGYVVGGGVTWSYPVFGIAGTSLTVEYLYVNLGTVTQNIPLTAVGPCGSTCNSFAQTSMKTDNSTVRLKLSFGL